jgi:hypothetical protein
MADDPMEILAQARAALKAGESHAAVRAYRRVQQLLPRDPEVPHERGLAHLEAGDVGLAALAQAEALALDPEHMGARAQRAAALEALGDDEGAARELDELLHRIGPNLALQARYIGLGESARRARGRRLLGNSASRLAASPLAAPLARSIGDPLLFKAPFAELRATAHGHVGDTIAAGRPAHGVPLPIVRLDLVFESMDSSMGRGDLTYGGATEDEQGRRVPLDEFTAAGIVFLSEALGIEPLRARRMLSFLLTPDCGLGPHKLAGCKVGWTIAGDDGHRHYGLFCET